MTDPANELHELREEVAALRQDVQGLVEAWRTATGVVRAVKWLGKVAGSLGAIYGLYRLWVMK